MALPRLSVVVPTLDEADNIACLLRSLQHPAIEIIVVDGGSGDATRELAARYADKVLAVAPGRARQMNAGAAQAQGDCLWFVHADSALTASVSDYLAVIEGAGNWGFFPLRLSGSGWKFRLIERAISWRSSLSSVASGDQGLFVRRELFEGIGGYDELPLMEDIALSKHLRQAALPRVAKASLQTSSRRWEERGVWRTVFLMWRLRLYYFLGASPHWLARQYR